MPYDYSRLSADKINSIFNDAKRDKKWDIVKEICGLSNEIRPHDANKAMLLEELQLKQQWNDIFSLQLSFNESIYEVIPGPLNKSSYTYQFEELVRDIMKNPASVDVEQIDGQSIIFANSKVYNWTTIITHVSIEHIELTQKDCDLYTYFKSNNSFNHPGTSELKAKDEEDYKQRLYLQRDSNTKISYAPHRMITFHEMEAINIYTGETGSRLINTLLRSNSIERYDISILVITALCASGLNKLPKVQAQECYRAVNIDNHLINQHIKDAVEGNVVFLSGFVSTSAHAVASSFKDLPFYYHFTGGIRGVDIHPISKSIDEYEVLLPPTNIQFSSYEFKDDKHCFETTICTDLEKIKTIREKPDIWALYNEDINTGELGHNFANLLFNAAFYGQIDAVESFVRLGNDINQPDNHGVFPISVATYFNPLNIIDDFIRLGADINIANEMGQTPIFDAAAHGQIEVIKKLYSLSADINKADHRGETAIFSAIRSNQVSTIEAMLDLNASVTNPNNDGKHCIFFVIQKNSEEMLDIFLRFGVSLDVLDAEGNTPLQFAIKKGYVNAARYLLNSGDITLSADLLKEMQTAFKKSVREKGMKEVIEEAKQKFEEQQAPTEVMNDKRLSTSAPLLAQAQTIKLLTNPSGFFPTVDNEPPEVEPPEVDAATLNRTRKL